MTKAKRIVTELTPSNDGLPRPTKATPGSVALFVMPDKRTALSLSFLINRDLLTITSLACKHSSLRPWRVRDSMVSDAYGQKEDSYEFIGFF
jgi:hypothetical protein